MRAICISAETPQQRVQKALSWAGESFWKKRNLQNQSKQLCGALAIVQIDWDSKWPVIHCECIFKMGKCGYRLKKKKLVYYQ